MNENVKTLQKPYFIISWQYPLTEKEEHEIHSNVEFSKGIDIDTDVYFSFLRCTNKTLERVKDEIKQSVISVDVPPSSCASKLAEIRLIEFYWVKGESFVETVNINSGMTLVQKVIRRNNLRAVPLSTVAAVCIN